MRGVIPFHDLLVAYGKPRERKFDHFVNLFCNAGSSYYGVARCVAKYLPIQEFRREAAVSATRNINKDRQREDNVAAINRCYDFLHGRSNSMLSERPLLLPLRLSPIRYLYRPFQLRGQNGDDQFIDLYFRRRNPLTAGAGAFSIYLATTITDEISIFMPTILFEVHQQRTFDSRHLALHKEIDFRRELAEIELAVARAYEHVISNPDKIKKRRQRPNQSDQTIPLPFFNS